MKPASVPKTLSAAPSQVADSARAADAVLGVPKTHDSGQRREAHRGTEVNLEQFAESHRLKTRRKGCGEAIITGKLKFPRLSKTKDWVENTSHVYDGFGDGRLGVLLSYPTKARWTYAKKKLVALGCVVRQNGDTEGCLTFDPASRSQVRAVLKAARVYPKKRFAVQPSPAQLAARQAFSNRRRPSLQSLRPCTGEAPLARFSDFGERLGLRGVPIVTEPPETQEAHG